MRLSKKPFQRTGFWGELVFNNQYLQRKACCLNPFMSFATDRYAGFHYPFFWI
jgi:hypothetical protein